MLYVVFIEHFPVVSMDIEINMHCRVLIILIIAVVLSERGYVIGKGVCLPVCNITENVMNGF